MVTQQLSENLKISTIARAYFNKIVIFLLYVYLILVNKPKTAQHVYSNYLLQFDYQLTGFQCQTGFLCHLCTFKHCYSWSFCRHNYKHYFNKYHFHHSILPHHNCYQYYWYYYPKPSFKVSTTLKMYFSAK